MSLVVHCYCWYKFVRGRIDLLYISSFLRMLITWLTVSSLRSGPPCLEESDMDGLVYAFDYMWFPTLTRFACQMSARD